MLELSRNPKIKRYFRNKELRMQIVLFFQMVGMVVALMLLFGALIYLS